MIIILLLISAVIAIIYTTWKNKPSEAIFASILCIMILTVILGISWGKSYQNYLEARSFYSATKEQYHSAIDIYAEYAVIDMGKASFTDFKYMGYQENISKFIADLRERIIEYNETIIEKRVMGKNPLLNWFIIEPDTDMLIIKMKAEPSQTSSDRKTESHGS
jgi:hypothetical protein